MALVCAAATGMAQAQSVSTYGTPGLLEIPTAEMFEDGMLVFTAAGLRNSGRGTMTFQMLPWVNGSFRYAVIDRFKSPDRTLYDRSFDVHFRLREESKHSPAIVMGLRDFGGTGIYAAEYFVATKTFQDRFKVTGGIGWGRMAGRGAFSNPLGIFGDRFDTRPVSDEGGISTTGQLDFGNWFRGDAALFGGVSWQYNDRLTFLAEYSPDLYTQEGIANGLRVKSPINVGLQYRFKNGTQLTTSYLYGTTLGLTLSYFVDPRKAVTPGGQGAAPPPLRPEAQIAAATADRSQGDIRDRLQNALDQEGLRLVYLSGTGDTVQVGVENNRYGQAAQALGRTARVLANEEPPQAEQFDIALMSNGVPLSAVRVNRDDLYELEHDPDNAWRSFARAEISDTIPLLQGGILTDAYPHFSYRFGPYLNLSFFDPDDPLRYEVGAALGLDYTLLPGFTLSTELRQPILSTLDDSTRVSDSPLPHVRSDWAIYARESNLRVEHMTAEYMWRPGKDLYARTTLGYLETMFGGLSTELLWYPTDSRLALGVEANYVAQRDYDVLFGFQDYNVATGHVSAYYDLPGDYHAQVDVGRYLAGDYGATFTLDREFTNGFKVGAFFTLTDVSFDDFGEGSFDKGIRLEIPVSWLTGRPSRNKIAQTIRPILRDGGARLNVRNRLYGVTREARAQDLSRGWGRFWR
ncbi:YjbH domain-containing protein [Ruegeria arenilitoris]|uniref:YjbH domain-containing protein n=1 Tax=Ruegeria arenilitoris TaxID=1173585 RepID=UPI00147C4BBC|nr:YjbH domain-containing protein [Ruegeria arenilitoris]